MPCDIVVDGGGSGTRLGIVQAGEIVLRRTGPSCNPRSTPQGASGALALAEMLRDLWARRPGSVGRIRTTCLALSNVSVAEDLASLEQELRPLARWCEPLRAACCWVVNDVVPLVASERCDAAVICGTGTGFAARGPGGTWARASGLESLLADEGGGFDVGLRGLRAAVRALDGRGPDTLLLARTRDWGAPDLVALHRKVYGAGEAKPVVASFAPLVLAAARAGDAVATAIARDAARELVAGLRAVAERCGLAGTVRFCHGGSLLNGDEPVLRDAFLAMLAKEPGRWHARPVPGDTLLPVADLAAQVSREPGWLDGIPLARRMRLVPA